MKHSSDKPLVSIITPSYNQGRFIEETIQSVLTQDYPYIEYIVVDGGSTDNTLEVLKKYGDRLKWISEPDKGQSDAINKGFAMAKGEILAWLNSDDIYLPEAVSRAVDFFCSFPNTGVVYGKAYYTDISGKVIGNYPTGPFDHKRLAVTNFICQPATFFRKQALGRVGGMDVNLHYSMDYDLWIRLSKEYAFGYVEEFLAAYRLHEDSKTVSPVHSFANHKECLDVVMRHYDWAPANRVYVYCHSLVITNLPEYIGKFRPLTLLFSWFVFIVLYLKLNRGLKIEDLKMSTPGNIKKLFKG